MKLAGDVSRYQDFIDTITGHVDPVDMSTWTQHRAGPA